MDALVCFIWTQMGVFILKNDDMRTIYIYIYIQVPEHSDVYGTTFEE